jgi:hypothetical protein
VLTILAVLFTVLALSNFSKPLHLRPAAGFVFLGMKTHGNANAVLGTAFGILLVAYAIRIWWMRRWALQIADAYAGYVILNLTLYTIGHNGASGQPSPAFTIGYVVAAIGVSARQCDRSPPTG